MRVRIQKAHSDCKEAARRPVCIIRSALSNYSKRKQWMNQSSCARVGSTSLCLPIRLEINRRTKLYVVDHGFHHSKLRRPKRRKSIVAASTIYSKTQVSIRSRAKRPFSWSLRREAMKFSKREDRSCLSESQTRPINTRFLLSMSKPRRTRSNAQKESYITMEGRKAGMWKMWPCFLSLKVFWISSRRCISELRWDQNNRLLKGARCYWKEINTRRWIRTPVEMRNFKSRYELQVLHWTDRTKPFTWQSTTHLSEKRKLTVLDKNHIVVESTHPS